MKYGLLSMIIVLLSLGAASEEPKEYFGRFAGEPQLQVKSNPIGRPTFVLLRDFSFKDPNGFEWTTPEGWEVDGASIPKAAWSLFGGPLSGRYLHASIIHDYYCDVRERTAHDTHRNFYYGMLANGVERSKAKTMYWAVRTFGPSWKIMRKGSGSVGGWMGYGGSEDITPVPAPRIPDIKARQLIDEIDDSLTLDELDELSDSTRIRYRSEALQTEIGESANGLFRIR